MELIVIGSSSLGNSYALRADTGEILLLEAGRHFREIKKTIGYATSSISGCIVSHEHGDHAKYIPEYLKAGIDVYSNDKVAEKYSGVKAVSMGGTFQIGDFKVTPFDVEHDVVNYGYLIHHPTYGSIFFATDCYNLKYCIKGCKTYLMECNYEDELLNKAVSEGKVSVSQADRIRLSHMSLPHAVKFLQDCDAEKSATQIVLIHGSARHLNAELAINKFQQVLGIPTYYAEKDIELLL